MERKDLAVSFLRMCAAGQAREAFAQHAAPRFRHHNPYFAGGAEAISAGMDDNARQFPGKALDIKRVIAERDLVALHSHVRMTPGDPGIAVVHIIRFEGDRVAELWDIGQQVPADSPNVNGMF